jgi:hypothetical protein
MDMHRQMSAFAVPLLLLALVASSGRAQALPDSLVGERVRLRLVGQPSEIEGSAAPQMLRGEVLGVTADSVTLRLHPYAGSVAIATAGVARIELSLGVRTRTKSAFHVGSRMALVGAAEWLLLDAISPRPTFEKGWQAGVAGAVTGAVVGGVLGMLRPQERWARLDGR